MTRTRVVCISSRLVAAMLLATLKPDLAIAEVSLDTSFGLGGIVTTDFGGAYDDLQGFSVGPSGSIYAVGTGGTSNRMGVAKYLPNGAPDNGFSNDGMLIIPTSAGSGSVEAQADGSVLLGVPQLSGDRGFRLMRYGADGVLDTSFGTGGAGFVPTGSQVYMERLMSQPDGKVLVGGYSFFDAESNWDFVMTRFNADGTPDASFGDNGRVRTDFTRTGITDPTDNLLAMTLLPDGRILAAGDSRPSVFSSDVPTTAMVRYMPDGSLDASFGVGGKVVVDLPVSDKYGQITGVKLLPDGKILATEWGTDVGLMRLNSDGSLDTTFGIGGVAASSGSPRQEWASTNDAVFDAEGRILTVNTDFSVSRFSADGVLDTTFGDNGVFSIDFGEQWRERGTRIEWQDDQHLLIGGYTTESPNVQSEWRMVRLSFEDPGPIDSVTVGPTVDFQLRPGNEYPIGDANGVTIEIDGSSGSSFPRLDAMLEFPLDGVPEGASLTSATLEIDAVLANSINVEVFGYAGDGLASLSDETASTQLVSTVFLSGGGVAEVGLNADFVESLLGEASHLGLRLASDSVGPFSRIASSESTNNQGPMLTLHFTSTGLAGDYNADGIVDAADYTVWRDNLGEAAGTLVNDIDGGVIGTAQHDTWAANYGATAQAPATSQTVPEPSAAVLLAAISWTPFVRRKNRFIVVRADD